MELLSKLRRLIFRQRCRGRHPTSLQHERIQRPTFPPAAPTSIGPPRTSAVAVFDATNYAIGQEAIDMAASHQLPLVHIGPQGPFDRLNLLIVLVPVRNDALSPAGDRLLTALANYPGRSPLRFVCLVWVIESSDRFSYSQVSSETNFAELLTGRSWERELVEHRTILEAVECRHRRVSEFMEAAGIHPAAPDSTQVVDIFSSNSTRTVQSLVLLADHEIHGLDLRVIGWDSVIAAVQRLT